MRLTSKQKAAKIVRKQKAQIKQTHKDVKNGVLGADERLKALEVKALERLLRKKKPKCFLGFSDEGQCLSNRSKVKAPRLGKCDLCGKTFTL